MGVQHWDQHLTCIVKVVPAFFVQIQIIDRTQMGLLANTEVVRPHVGHDT